MSYCGKIKPGRSASLISKAFQLSRTFTASHKLTSNVYYTKKHEWIKVDGDVGIVGISEYAEQKLGDIVYVELPVVGDTFSVNDQCAVVESVKAVSEIYSPASGTILEVNNDVTKNTKIINKSPLDEGWFFKLRLSDLSQIKDLLSEESYNEFLTSES
ncbi:Glycine cleavage system H protein [Schistosoma japonicum]|nr:Glycine cleavage system H protein [Schistosoma japonicum]